MAIPSQARKHFREGVETRRAAPKPHVGNGEGIVQTTNPRWRGGESRSGMKIRRPQGREGSIPSARTKLVSNIGQDGAILACFRHAKLGRSDHRYSIDSKVSRVLGWAQVTRPQSEGAFCTSDPTFMHEPRERVWLFQRSG